MAELSHDIQRFIADHIDSLERLEILLLLRGESARWFDAPGVTRELRLGPVSAGVQLGELTARGFLSMEGEPPRFRFAPRSGDVARLVSELARAYAERKVAVITAIFSPRTDAARSLADAFRLRRK